jgi:hypothetical protein
MFSGSHPSIMDGNLLTHFPEVFSFSSFDSSQSAVKTVADTLQPSVRLRMPSSGI